MNKESLVFDYIDADKIEVWKQANVRRTGTLEELDELKNNIKSVGIEAPVLVKEVTPNKKYKVISGQRRFEALKQLGEKKIPCMIRKNVSVTEAILLSLSENLYRTEMNPNDRSHAIMILLEKFHNPEEVAKKLGVHVHTVRNYIEWDSIPQRIRNFLEKGSTYTQILNIFRKFPNEQDCYDILRDYVSIKDRKKKRKYYRATKEASPSDTPKKIREKAERNWKREDFVIHLPIPTARTLKGLATKYEQDAEDVIEDIVEGWVEDFKNGKVIL